MAEAAQCARVIVEELLGQGVREAVLAPGSRSAPLAYELFEADRIGLLRLHVRIDERGAGFLALGLAKASGAPVAALTTSGTAAANLHPAVLEAWHSHVPLVVVTASRPRLLVHTGSNQTADQRGLYGRHVRAEASLADRPSDPYGWRFEVARLLVAATGARSRAPGPVHLDVELAEPLVPTESATVSLPDLTIEPGPTAVAATELPAGPNTVIVAGDLPPWAGVMVAEQAAAAAVPLLAEPSSNARRGAAAVGTYRVLLGSDLAREIERVVVVGRPTLSRPVTRLLSSDDLEIVVVSPHADWVDPGRRATRVVSAVSLTPGSGEWLQRWRAADGTAARSLQRLVDAQPGLTGPALAAAVWAALNENDTFVIGSSNPIRDADLAPISASPPATYANRGLSGIDGTVSTAFGVALAVERPTHALLGDLTALHDLTGLFAGPDEPRADLRLIVANDDGGSIFATLEHGDLARRRSFERVFATPQRADFAALAAGAGVAYRRIEHVREIRELLGEPPVGVELVEARVDRTTRRELHAAIAAIAHDL